ncbi:MAG: hypothetical protein II086_04860, partial [Ruminococcus sp.]|nr:hypothetical protein [Ruminococcus sp.]
MMKHTNKRLPILLLFALVLSLLPWAATPALALETPEQKLETPAKPELETCTDKSITLKTVTPPEGCAVEYGVCDGYSDTIRWQTSTLFTEDPYGEEFDIDENYRFYDFYVRFTDGEETAVSEVKNIPLAYIAPNLPTGNLLGCGDLYGSSYNIFDPEKGKLTAMWDKDSRTMTLDDFSGAEGQYVYLSSACTLVLRGENTLDAGETHDSLSIDAEENTVVIRGEGENPRLALRGMGIQANRLSIENCTIDLSWVTHNSNCYCAKIVNSGSATEIALTDARLLCPAPPKPAPDENIHNLAFDMDSCNNSCSIALTRSTFCVAAPATEDEMLSEDCVRHHGKETNDPADISLLALTLKERSVVNLNGKDTFYTKYGTIAVSADETSSAVFRGTVYVNTYYSIGGISLGGNITIEAQEDNTIKASALNITAPGVTLTSPKGYYFDDYTLAEGVVAVPTFTVFN